MHFITLWQFDYRDRNLIQTEGFTAFLAFEMDVVIMMMPCSIA
jgi:hypothetical protein